jgi:hypothetical protein
MFLGSRARPVHRPDNLTAICEQIVYTMWDSRITLFLCLIKRHTIKLYGENEGIAACMISFKSRPLCFQFQFVSIRFRFPAG